MCICVSNQQTFTKLAKPQLLILSRNNDFHIKTSIYKYFSSSFLFLTRVATLQSRVSELRTELYSNVIQKLISKSYVEEGITTTRRREVVTEVKLVESNPAFRHVQYCLNWIEAKQVRPSFSFRF